MPPHERTQDACARCLAHSWLLGSLSARLELRGRNVSRLLEVLELEDAKLIDAIGGRRRQELHRPLREAVAGESAAGKEGPSSRASMEGSSVCRHSPLLRGAAGRSPDWLAGTLHLSGGADQLQSALSKPVVAIVGAKRASPYGRQMASHLAASMSSAGITVGATLREGIGAAALAGAVGGHAVPVGVMAGGLDVVRPAHLSGLYRWMRSSGLLASEMPAGTASRRWCETAAARTLAGMADLVVVVEARGEDPELAVVRYAWALGRKVAAVPGQLTCRGAEGPHRLIQEGAHLVSGAQDVLDALYGVSPPVGRPAGGAAGSPDSHCQSTQPHTPRQPHTSRQPHTPSQPQPPEPQPSDQSQSPDLPEPPRLPRRLLAVLDRVGSGEDTLESLGSGHEAAKTLVAVAELEAMGMICRGPGGRYLPCVSMADVRAR